MKAIEQIEMVEHCIRQIQKHPYHRKGLEHFVFLTLLETCPETELRRHGYLPCVQVVSCGKKEKKGIL